MTKYICLKCGKGFQEEQSNYLPVCPECGEVVEAIE